MDTRHLSPCWFVVGSAGTRGDALLTVTVDTATAPSGKYRAGEIPQKGANDGDAGQDDGESRLENSPKDERPPFVC